jgi:hypothetical protein
MVKQVFSASGVDVSCFLLSRHCIPAGGPRLFTDEDIKRIGLYDGAAGSGKRTVIQLTLLINSDSVPVISIFTKLDAEYDYASATVKKGRKGLRGTVQSNQQVPDSGWEYRIEDCIQRLGKTSHPPEGFVRLKGIVLVPPVDNCH